MPTRIFSRSMIFIALLCPVVAFGQTKLQILVDSDGGQVAGEYEVIIKSKDAAISSVLVSSPDLPMANWTTHKISVNNQVSTKLLMVENKTVVFSFVGFDSDGKVVETRKISLPKTAPSERTTKKEGEGSGEQGGKTPDDKLKACTPVVKALVQIVENSESKSESRGFALRELGNYGLDATCALDTLSKYLSSKQSDGKWDEESRKQLELVMVSIVRRAGKNEDGLTTVSGRVVDDHGVPIEGSRVEVLNPDGETVTRTFTDADGKYSLDDIPKSSVATVVADSGEGFSAPERSPVGAGGSPKERNFTMEREYPRNAGQFSRVILGFEQAGATAAPSQRNFFLDGHFSVPIPWQSDWKVGREDFEPVWRLWGNMRVASAPDPAVDDVAVQTFVQEFAGRAASTQVGKIVQTFEVTSGVEIRLRRSGGYYYGNESGVKNRITASLIAGAGIVAPINPEESIGTRIFEVSPEAEVRYPQAVGKKYIAFVAPERDRFYRQYFAGLRFKTFYFSNGERFLDRYPATLDITYGQNEAITGGFLRGGVMKIEGFFPFPISKKFGSLFIFGTAQMKFSKPNFGDPLILRRITDGSVSLPSPDAAIVTILPQNRDYYRIGVGVDPIRLFKDFRNLAKSDQNIPALPSN